MREVKKGEGGRPKEVSAEDWQCIRDEQDSRQKRTEMPKRTGVQERGAAYAYGGDVAYESQLRARRGTSSANEKRAHLIPHGRNHETESADQARKRGKPTCLDGEFGERAE